jgi:AmmeMemoRadiSam system protein A/AmmeMemoRadiSam system protein B
MAHASSLVFTGIAPHPPIMVPEVGREASAEVRRSIDAMAKLTERVIACRAETVVIVSPHAPLQAAAFIAYDGPQLYGDFANFRAPAATIHADLDEELLDEITRAAAADELAVLKIKGRDLDHGTAVPLYFLQRNGWRGRVIALGYSFLSNEDHLRFGKCIREAIEKVGRRVAVIASGDLSHRLQLDAPAGYNPDAHLFDEEVIDAIRNCSTNRIVDIDDGMRRMAGECGYRSMLVAIGAAAQTDAQNCELFSYEAPFGVGYLVAQLVGSAQRPGADAGRIMDADIPALARRAVEVFATTGKIIEVPEDVSESLSVRAGCFVSIKTRDGELRGCIGTIDPAKDTLAEEIIANALASATSDPRFPQVHADELANLKYSVDVLSPPQACTADDLDPNIFGVIVEDETGRRRGLLLPNLPNIDTARKQIEMASRKAGIQPNAAIRLFRFRADRYSE